MKRSATRYVNIEILLTKKIHDDGRNTLEQARIEARKFEWECFRLRLKEKCEHVLYY